MPVNYERKIIGWYDTVNIQVEGVSASCLLAKIQEVEGDYCFSFDEDEWCLVAEKRLTRLETDEEYNTRIANEEKKERERLEKAVARQNILKVKEEKELAQRKALYEQLKKEFEGESND